MRAKTNWLSRFQTPWTMWKLFIPNLRYRPFMEGRVPPRPFLAGLLKQARRMHGCAGHSLCALLLAAGMARADAGLEFAFDHYPWREGTNAPPPAPASASARWQVQLERDDARPWERWIEVGFHISPEVDLAKSRLAARLIDLGAAKPAAALETVPEHCRGRLSVDLRRHGLRRGRLALNLIENGQTTDVFEVFLRAEDPPAPLPPDTRIPVVLDVPPASSRAGIVPVTFGVPFPAGAAWDGFAMRLVDDGGGEAAMQTEITGRWARDGAVQWVRVDALVDPALQYYLEMAPSAAAPAAGVSVSEQNGQIILDTGAARYVLGGANSPIAEVWLGERRLATTAGARGLYVVDQTGREASAVLDENSLRVEARGPVAACVRCEGFYRAADGTPLARYIVRVEAFAGLPQAKITHTLVLSEDTQKVWFREIGWEFAVDAGAGVRAVFNAARADSAQVVAQELAPDTAASMLQDAHFQLGAGTNHFSIAAGNRVLHQGEECGDWAMLHGARGGWLAVCREVARQHPKEFEISAGRFSLKLFSHRAGDELDFRPATLAKKWHLDAKKALALQAAPGNAAGWAKTHELLFAPLPPPRAAALAPALAAAHSRPVYAAAAPDWICRSGALGPLHPRDPENFARAEQLIDACLRFWGDLALTPGHYGFVNYFAGPTYSGPANYSKRYRSTYGTRSGAWLVYARSGGRAAREFAAGINRSFMDNWLTHWEAPGKVRGVYLRHGGELESYPLFWGGETAFQIDSSTDLNQFLWMYQLTGYRRAGDVLEQFAAGLKQGWRPAMHAWRKLMVFRVLTQAYGFTWDPELRALADATYQTFYDPQSAVSLTKDNRPYKSSTYKLGVDVRGLIEAERIYGTPIYHESLSWARDSLPGVAWPLSYMNPFGYLGDYIYRTTGDPSVAAAMEYAIRRAGTAYNPAAGTYSGDSGASSVAAFFEGLPYAMSVVARAGALRQRPASWLAFQDYGFPTRIVAQKENLQQLDLEVQMPWDGQQIGTVGGVIAVQPLGHALPWGLDLNQVAEREIARAQVRIPRDAPGGAYALRYAPRSGSREFTGWFVMARQRVPLVLYAPEYWQLPDIVPAANVYFKLPQQSASARIFLEGRGRLYDPAGKLFGSAEGAQGWVSLPGDRPGLWRLEPLENRLIRAEGFPPFFAMHEPEFYFEPPIDWRTELPSAPSAAAALAPAGERFAPGRLAAAPGNRAAVLRGNEQLVLDAGPPHPGGDGGLFLPQRAGTIEFYFRPAWGTFDLGTGAVERCLLRLSPGPGRGLDWGLTYRVDPAGTAILGGPISASHALFGWIYADTPNSQPYWVRCWMLQTLMEREEWVHLAYVWGLRPARGPHGEPLSLLNLEIFCNGRSVRKTVFANGHDGVLPKGAPSHLALGPLDGVVDELRISDVQRYQGAFTPAPRAGEWELDEHTRALCRFNGDLSILTGAASAPPAEALITSGEK